MHMDNGMTFSNNKQFLWSFCEDLQKIYAFRWNSNPSLHLGVHITRDWSKHTLLLDQSHYCESMLERFGMSNCNGVKTPLPQNLKLATPSLDNSTEIKQYCAAAQPAYLARSQKSEESSDSDSELSPIRGSNPSQRPRPKFALELSLRCPFPRKDRPRSPWMFVSKPYMQAVLIANCRK